MSGRIKKEQTASEAKMVGEESSGMGGIELINASAGSGKTFTLAKRVFDVLTREHESIAPSELAATTFTKKAAAELRERIRLQLLEKGENEAAQGIYDGFLGTVNSICARLLREYAIDAGLSPALDVMPEEDASRLFNIATSAALEAYSADINPIAYRLSCDGAGTNYAKTADWRDMVRSIVNHARVNLLDKTQLEECARESWTSLSEVLGEISQFDLDASLDRELQNTIELFNLIAVPAKTTKPAIDAVNDFAKRRNRSRELRWVEWLRLSKLKTAKDGQDAMEELRKAAGSVTQHPRFQADMQALIEMAFSCAARALKEYEEYKSAQGLTDFVDQETQVLQLAETNDAFRSSMRQRLGQMMVDEFQDTSPVQLALFLQLHNLADASIWVGDPKQSIFGFRDTDPQLMMSAAERMRQGDALKDSWRSKTVLVDFTNELFTKVFHTMKPEHVRLGIPEQRKDEAKGGWIESWNLTAGNQPDEAAVLADGVLNLLNEHKEVKRSGIAILCRGNKERKRIAAALERVGIRASASRGKLLETPECRLALAALRVMQDKKDTLALTEIVRYSPLHSSHADWISALIGNRIAAIASWEADPLIQSLTIERETLVQRTPLEALEAAIAAVQLEKTIALWGRAELRRANLDQLRLLCSNYRDHCLSRRAAATITGFLRFAEAASEGQAEGSGDDTVNIVTYHKAKGLEWPIVILSSLNTEARGGAFGVHVVPAAVFDPAHPLAGRRIRFWPWPFASQKNIDSLDAALADRPEKIYAEDKARDEACRLLYVGMTRAREGLILAVRKNVTAQKVELQHAWLNLLTDANNVPLLNLPLEPGESLLPLGDVEIPLRTLEYLIDANNDKDELNSGREYLPETEASAKEYPSARINPSKAESPDEDNTGINIETIANLGDRIHINGKPDPAHLGSAIHGFLAVDQTGMYPDRRLAIAERLLHRWGVDGAITPSDLLGIHDRLHRFIADRYPNCSIRREWPVTMRNEQHQLMQGRIDMLLEIEDGVVIIDHKSYRGSANLDQTEQGTSQLGKYSLAVHRALRKNAIALYLFEYLDADA
ncbi:MAG: UvrD-helicase domain-containing protein [Bacteroidota bacterium]